MAEIKVDQSHCNHYATQQLIYEGWDVLFTDPGRVSRGGIGKQGGSLRIFEEFGLPIPDIVAINGKCLLLIEVDATISKAIASLKTYIEHKQLLLEKFSVLCNEYEMLAPTMLNLGFCRTGLIKNVNGYISKKAAEHTFVDLWITFEAPQMPNLQWCRV